MALHARRTLQQLLPDYRAQALDLRGFSRAPSPVAWSSGIYRLYETANHRLTLLEL